MLDAEAFFEIVDRLELGIGTSVFPFEELQDTLILAGRASWRTPTP